MTAAGPTVAARSTAGTAEMIGPMIGTSSSSPAMTDSRTAYRPKIGSTSWLRTISPMNVKMPTAKPRMIWPRTHWPKSRSTVLMTAQASNRQAAGSDRSNGRDERRLVLEDVGDPDRQDEVREDGPEQAAGAGDERQQERQVGAAAAAAAALADPGDERRRSTRGSRPGSGALA